MFASTAFLEALVVVDVDVDDAAGVVVLSLFFEGGGGGGFDGGPLAEFLVLT